MVIGYDYIRWSKYLLRVKDIKEFASLEGLKNNFILELEVNKLPLHFYASDFIDNKCPYFLVGFSGAMSSRTLANNPPYFSFINLAKSTKLPLLSVSDPTMYLDNDLVLSWYLGNHKIVELQKLIAETIESFAKKFNKIPILCGGSGGGFASLAVSSLLNIKNYVLVWNPQVDVLKYYKRFVNNYIQVAYPSFEGNIIKTFQGFSQKQKVILDLSKIKLSDQANVLYLQNFSDAHTELHAKPFISAHSFDEIKVNLFRRKGYYVIIGNWGVGHAPLPKGTIEEILLEISNNYPFEKLALNMHKQYDVIL